MGQFTNKIAKESSKKALIFGAINMSAQLAMGNDNVGQTFLDGAKTGGIYGGIYGAHMHRNIWNKMPVIEPKDIPGYVVDKNNNYHGGMNKYLSKTRTLPIPFTDKRFIIWGGNHEGIYDSDKNIYTGSDYGGTFNYLRFGPAHFIVDMVPYFIWGNGPIAY